MTTVPSEGGDNGAPPQQQIMINARPEVAEGLYANFANISENNYEISVDFVNVHFASGTGALVARIAMSHIFAEQLATTLSETVGRYAGRVIEEAGHDGETDESDADDTA